MKRVLVLTVMMMLAATTFASASTWHLAVYNKSDACVWFTIDKNNLITPENLYSAVIPAGTAHAFSGSYYNQGLKARAQVWKQGCGGPFVSDRYDNIPNPHSSDLSIHGNSKDNYIMRFGK
jgi:hypothetical protein